MNHAKHIISTVCRELDIRESLLLSASRRLNLVRARMIIVLLLERRGYTDEQSGWFLNRARATITVMRNKAHEELKIYPAFRQIYEQIKYAVDNGKYV